MDIEMDPIAALRGVTQRVAQQAKFDACVRGVEAHNAKRTEEYNKHIAKLAEENNKHIAKLTEENNKHIAKLTEENNKLTEENDKLEALAFRAGVVLRSKDGTQVPAIKQMLVASSDVFVGMFSGGLAEGRDGIVRTDASAEALRYVSRCVHISGGGGGADTETLLEVCELAERWQLPEVLRAAAAAFGDRLNSSTALKTLVSADRHIQAGSGAAVWKDILEDAAKAVAAAMPTITEDAEFKMLSIEAVAHVMLHLKENTFELPVLEGGLESDGYGDWSEPVSWLKDDNLTPSVHGQQFRLDSSIEDGKVSFSTVARFRSSPTLAYGTMKLTNPDGSCPWKKKVSEALYGPFWGSQRIVTEDTAARCTTNGRFWLSGSVTVAKEQRQSEVLNLWLLASGAAEAPLGLPAQLQCLRACACGFDFGGADAEMLTAKLKEHDLPTDGQLRTLQTRLRDAMFAELSLSPALRQASSALATLNAAHFEYAAADTSLFDLDAASMSQVLAHKNLKVESEKHVLDHVLRWASYDGRTAEMVDKVIPLVRFPLIALMKPPAKLKELKARSAVVAELITEAVKYQVGNTSRSSPAKKHALLPSMPSDTEQPRTKRRRFCRKDKVPKVDVATTLVKFAF